MSATSARSPLKRRLRTAFVALTAGVMTIAPVTESFAQRGIGGVGGGRMIGNMGGGPIGGGPSIGRPIGGTGPGGFGNRIPGGNDAPRNPGGGVPRRPGGGILVVPSGGGPIGPGPGRVIVVEDDEPAPRRTKRRVQKAKKTPPPKGPQKQQFAQRGGFSIPPAGENRFVPDEVLLNMPPSVTLPLLDQIARRHRLTRLELRDFVTTRRRLARLRITDGRPVATVIRALQADARILGAQPNYLYTLEQAKQESDPAQYAIGKMRVPQAHEIAKGASVRVAVIDTQIDANHPDLAGTVAASYDATGTREPPHAHGTAIAGVIAARGRLKGVAPAVALLGVNAFSAQSSRGTGMNILKGLDWAAGVSKANVINMSFAGPPDGELQLMIETARRNGIILVAAAGNAGPKSRPLFPAAYPDVIAVTATDIDDKVFDLANRGTHIAIAAPGVAILVVAPGEGYQMQSGTSFAAAQVSGVAALLLERNRKLDAPSVRSILTSTARDLGAPGHDDQFGAGLIDALGAVEQAGPKASDVSGSAAQRSN